MHVLCLTFFSVVFTVHASLYDTSIQGNHNISFQMPEILLFDTSESQSGDGVSTGGVYPSRLCSPEIFLKSGPNQKTSLFLMWFIVYLLMNSYAFR